MSSHVNTKVDDKFKEWMKYNYVNHGEMKANRGKVHEYLGITFDFTEKVKVKINMDNYVEKMINEFPMITSKSDTSLTPAGNNILKKVTENLWVKNKLNSYILQLKEECLWPREKDRIFIKRLWCCQQVLKN